VIPVQLFLFATLASTMNGVVAKPQPRVSYTLTIDTTDLSGIDVSMQIEGAPRSMHLAMAVHPEYNQRFWRYVRNLRAEVVGKAIPITAETDHSWRITTPDGNAVVRYRIQLPLENQASRAVWHTALRTNGASINSTDTFLYLPEFARSPVEVRFTIPQFWQIRAELPVHVSGAAGVTQYSVTTDATTLLDSPILLGALHTWSFAVQGVPHRVVYWPLANSTSFDTTEFVRSIEKFAEQAFALFGKAPYSSYTFLIEDGAFGGLEHVASVTIGAQSRDLANDPRALMGEIAHEFFHTWNLMALNPRGPLTATPNPPLHTRELWWSEGITMYYAETLQRRAGIPEAGKTRLKALEEQLDSFYGNSGNSYLSPERGSWASIDPPTLSTGDYLSNYYTQGRLIGYALDIIIGDSTGGRRGMDDVMRLMYDRFAKKRAFTGRDIERAISEVCQCNVRSFFDDHVRRAKPIDFNRLLASLGLRVALATSPVADTSGARFPDLRITAYAPPAGGRMRVRIMDPRTVWTSAGIHTGMEWGSLNRIQIDSFPDFRRAIRSIRLGDVVPVEVFVPGDGTPRHLTVSVPGYERTRARVVEIPDATPAQLERRQRWLSAAPSHQAQP